MYLSSHLITSVINGWCRGTPEDLGPGGSRPVWWKQLLLAHEPWEGPDGPRAGRGGLCWKFKGFWFKYFRTGAGAFSKHYQGESTSLGISQIPGATGATLHRDSIFSSLSSIIDQ